MSASFDFEAPDRFTAGAVGDPGSRTFYLQAVQDRSLVSLKLEKQQVAALCEYLAGILADLPGVPDTELPAELELVEPVLPEWVVGSLAVAYEEPTDRILLVAEELVPEPEEADDPDLPPELAPEPPPAAVARFRLTRGQVKALVDHATSVVSAGRELCRLCGRPIDPEGHLCPRNN